MRGRTSSSTDAPAPTSTPAVAELRAAYDVEVSGVVGDSSTAEVHDALLAACAEPDIVLLNGEGPSPTPFSRLTDDALDAAFQQAVVGPVGFLQRVVPGMVASTLDLVPIDRPVLFTFGEHERWAAEVGDTEITVVRVGVDTPALDPWRQVCEVGVDGALLVRPDQHVAWRARSVEKAPELARALSVVAGHIEPVTEARHATHR